MVTLGVIIPCRNDCAASAKLISSFSEQTIQPDKFVVGHDKCLGKSGCVQFGNKAATINFYARHLSTDYILVLDADMVLTPTFFEAFKIAFERNMPTVGSGVIYSLSANTAAMKNRLFGFGSGPMRWYWFGGCMYMQRNFLVANPLPTETVLEDIIYGKLLEKKGINAEFVPNAVCFMWRKNESVKRQLRRQIRFMLGGLEQTRYHLGRYAVALYVALSVGYLLSLLVAFRLNLFFGVSLFLGYTFLVASCYYSSSLYEENSLPVTLAYSLLWFPIRCYTIALFITGKKIW